MGLGNTIIRASDVSKCYRIGLKEKMHDSIGSALIDFIKSPLNNYRKYRSLYRFDDINKSNGNNGRPEDTDVIWALHDVSFEIKQGEVVGIIGRNGAGKSTLLKIISRITAPTSGFIELRGRVSSLLEVGTGFHPELTGRENIYLNGTILGMKKTEIDSKFDEIVEFSGVEKFLDTPVKRYSSGMRVRLAFSVAAHLEPEVLVIDEVLAVGDADFQKKCLNKMKEVGSHGRTVLFVSHNMPAVTRLCDRVILLQDGGVYRDGPSHKVVSAYLHSGYGTMAEREWVDPAKAPSSDIARLFAVRIKTEDGKISDAMDIRQEVRLEMEYDVLSSDFVLLPNFHLINEDGVEVCCLVDLDSEWRKRRRPAGRYITTARIPGNLLSEGTLFVRANLCTLDPLEIQFDMPDAVAFQVIDSLDGDSARGDYAGPFPGVVRPMTNWSTQFSSNGKGVR